MPETSLADWLLRLESLHPEEIELGLDRVSAVADRLCLLPIACPVVSVAGTNGKGSTIAVLDALLSHAGRRVGRYTSPHLLRYNERVCVAGEPVSDAQLIASFERVELGRGDIPLTYFEFGTLAALDLFLRAGVDCMLLEVGLGGRLDAVNIVDPDIVVITSIALDHESWLGSDREQIAREKAGILRPGVTMVCVDTDPPLALQKRAAELQCVCHYLSADEVVPYALSPSLRGENIAAACRSAEIMGVDLTALDLAGVVSRASPPGRMQQLQVGGVDVILDVAHNPAAVENLAATLRTLPSSGRCLALFAVLSDKNIHAMIRSCQDVFDAWFVAALPRVPRAAVAADVVQELRNQGVTMVSESKNPRQAWRRARSLMGAGDRLVVFGSFYTVAEILPVLEKERSKV
ncbi:MAG: bifunctional folylpolyglutamate synthase/dihydrofolate synthase [Gammaproteobacteria bacterium]|nr:bifunctional folylpolyglutamate synthase/dihydrofolate synthase [Gammaproteobacteria bacterium]